MSSLVPGSLFFTTGLNRKHTPTPNNISNDELDERYARTAFNGRPWPPSSPVAGVYDMRNSSTQLILLNNKRKKESQLRGRSNPRKEEHRYPEPERHSRCSTPVNPYYHDRCLDSSSPYYEPELDLDMDWLNRSQRPQNTFAAGSAVNPKRHTSCQVPSNPRAFDIQLHSARRPNSRTSLPASFGKGPMMGYQEMNPGEQRYFASISRVYLNNQMIRLKRRQYIDLLNQELTKGLYTKKEYERYRDYIALGRQRQYMNVRGRAASAPLRRTVCSDTDTNRSYSSFTEDEKSSVLDANAKNKNDKGKEATETKQTKRSKSPDKRPTSVTSTSSSKQSVGRNSVNKSRSSSAKSTTSSAKSYPAAKSDIKKTGDDKKEEEDLKQSDEKESESTTVTETKTESNTESKENEDNAVGTSETTTTRDLQTSDSDTNLPSEKQFSAREGHDRPKSRLGHIPGKIANKEDTQSSQDEGTKDEKDLENEIKKEFKDDDQNEKETKNDTTQNKEEEVKQVTTQSKQSRDSSDSDSDSEEEQIKDPDKLQY